MVHSPVSPITWQLKLRYDWLGGSYICHSPVSPITWQLKQAEANAKTEYFDIHQYHQLPGN